MNCEGFKNWLLCVIINQKRWRRHFRVGSGLQRVVVCSCSSDVAFFDLSFVEMMQCAAVTSMDPGTAFCSFSVSGATVHVAARHRSWIWILQAWWRIHPWDDFEQAFPGVLTPPSVRNLGICQYSCVSVHLALTPEAFAQVVARSFSGRNEI